ncbi:MAG: UDP-glucose 4-epimerase GalE [Myxococcales bacterium]|nr:UDP-glucose 4-epimerase GalE [Myxococcales bacterium]
MAHLLVTGGAGYIGCHTLRALSRAGHSAVVLDDLRSGDSSFVGNTPLVRADVADRTAVARAFSEQGPFDGVLHFAALISAGESMERPLAYYANNVGGSAALLEVALAHGVRIFVLSSTAAVYGEPERQPIAETARLEPINPYGASKVMVERMLADAQTAHGLRWTALRYFNAAGADPDGGLGECHDPETHLIPVALEAACGLRDSFELFGTDYPTPDGSCIRDYVHVTDLAAAHVLATEALLEGRTLGARNLGTGRGHSNREVLAAVERAVGRPVPIREAARRPGDPPKLLADASRFRQDLGWQPRHSDLETIVDSAWAWLRRWKRL